MMPRTVLLADHRARMPRSPDAVLPDIAGWHARFCYKVAHFVRDLPSRNRGLPMASDGGLPCLVLARRLSRVSDDTALRIVIPTKVGIHRPDAAAVEAWIPAFPEARLCLTAHEPEIEADLPRVGAERSGTTASMKRESRVPR